MIDREKVIGHLNDCMEASRRDNTWVFVRKDIVEDALALLKEQEAVEPKVEVLNEIDRIYRCPKCHKHFFYEKQKYCDQCGQAVKWK